MSSWCKFMLSTEEFYELAVLNDAGKDKILCAYGINC